MSIETDINRIATSLEEIVKHIKSLGTPGKTPRKAPAAAVVPATPVKPAVDAITGEPVAAVEQPTQDQVHAALQVYMEKAGVDGPAGVKAVMIKHGANKVKPTITSIPPANYAALLAEITAVK